MINVLNKKILALTAMFLGGCSYFTNTVYTRHVVQPLVKNPTSVVVCREKQCAPARLSMSREYIYNSLTQLLQNNKGSKALLCTADAASHTCTEEFLIMPIKVGITPANMYIDNVKITNVKVSKGAPKLDLILNYNVTYNGQTPDCRPATTTAFVESADSIMMEDSGYVCKMTTIGTSSVKTMFAIDYIDLDYGYIGGYYSIGISGPANGGGAGYMLIRLPVNAYPLAPALTNPEESPAMQQEVMINNVPNMNFNGPQTIHGKPITKFVEIDGMSATPNKSTLQVFPIYNKKSVETPAANEEVKAEAKEDTKEGVKAQEGSSLKDNLSDK